MNNQNLIIYDLSFLYKILKELEYDLNLKIIEVSSKNSLNNEIKNLKSYLIITKVFLLNTDKQYIFDKSPIKISKLIEKFNIELLKQQFNDQSKININNYVINLNAREISLENTKLKLTEKEVNTILYLLKTKKPVSVDELQTNVWGYHSDIETHTVETHIYRLRKKFLNIFEDKNFIINKKNGYQIN